LRAPAHPVAEEAKVLFVPLMARPVLWTLEERLTRARRFLDAGAPDRALAEIQEADAQKLARGASAQARTALIRAAALFSLGKEPEGLKALEVAQKGQSSVAADALMFKARRTMRGPDLAEARKQMGEVEHRYPKEPPAVEAGFLAG